MCLYPNLTQTKKFLHKNRNKKRVVVWKCVAYATQVGEKKKSLLTIFRCQKVSGGWLHNNNPGYFKRLSVEKICSRTEISDCAIHAFTTRARARKICAGFERVMRCEALMEDLIAVGSPEYGDVCFDKIDIPHSEVNRCIQFLTTYYNKK